MKIKLLALLREGKPGDVVTVKDDRAERLIGLGKATHKLPKHKGKESPVKEKLPSDGRSHAAVADGAQAQAEEGLRAEESQAADSPAKKPARTSVKKGS